VVQQSWEPKRWRTRFSPLNWSAAERAAIIGSDTKAMNSLNTCILKRPSSTIGGLRCLLVFSGVLKKCPIIMISSMDGTGQYFSSSSPSCRPGPNVIVLFCM
jgi:hypothetical protein